MLPYNKQQVIICRCGR